MGRARAAIRVAGRASEAEALWYDTRRWPSFVDGLRHVAKVEGEWPSPGARVVWDSHQGGRGRVVEEVLAYETRSGQQLRVEDERTTGTQRVRFEPNGTEELSIGLEYEYEIKSAGAFTPLVDRFFVRRAMRDSLRRTLHRFARELEAERTEAPF